MKSKHDGALWTESGNKRKNRKTEVPIKSVVSLTIIYQC